jgi:hypothetical protein
MYSKVLVYANDVNLLGDNIDTIKKTLIDASKEQTDPIKMWHSSNI